MYEHLLLMSYNELKSHTAFYIIHVVFSSQIFQTKYFKPTWSITMFSSPYCKCGIAAIALCKIFHNFLLGHIRSFVCFGTRNAYTTKLCAIIWQESCRHILQRRNQNLVKQNFSN